MKMDTIRKNRVLFLSIILALMFILPFVGLAQGGLVPCTNDCNFGDFVELLNNVINWFILVGGSVAALGFAYVGFIYLTKGGNPSERAKAKEIFRKIAVGFFFLLGSWLIVKLIIAGLGGNPSDLGL